MYNCITEMLNRLPEMTDYQGSLDYQLFLIKLLMLLVNEMRNFTHSEKLTFHDQLAVTPVAF